MRSAWVAMVTAAVIVSACGPAPAASPQATAPPASTVPSTAGPSAPPASPTRPPAATARFEFADAAVVDTALAGTNDKFINPGAVIEVDGTLHMFANSFSQWPGRIRVPHLTSTDGVTWVLDDDAAGLDSDQLPMADPGIDVSTGYLADDGTWVLYFETVQKPGTPWEVWRATAPSAQGPWTTSDEAVLRVGPAGAFDQNGITWPSVIRVGDRWAMYYAGITGTGRGTGAIGLAFSDDGITWLRDADPVIVASEGWEFGSVDRPRVVAVEGGYVMVYAGRELTNRGLATSTDGRTWTKVPGPAIDRTSFPLAGGSWDAALQYRGGSLEYFLEIGSQTTKVYRSTLAWP